MKKKNIRATREALKAQKIKKSQENEALKNKNWRKKQHKKDEKN